jgi:hypothetical protein
MANTENNALQVQKQGFNALANAEFGELMAEELNGLELTFEKVKIPSGGGIVYEVPGADGEPDTVKDFKAVILYHHPLNCYYKTKYTGGSNPPDCGSFDGIAGIGDPGGKCKTCPLNQYESADEGKGKACKNRRRIYILREGDVFPMLLSLPTGSLKVFTKYVQLLITQNHSTNTVVTKFSLKKAINKGGIDFSQGVFALDRELTPDEKTAIQPLMEQVKEYAASVEFTVDADTGEVIS